MGQGGECGGGLIYWPGKHNPGQSRNVILVCIRAGWERKRRGAGLEGDSPREIGESISKERKVISHKVSAGPSAREKKQRKKAMLQQL